MTPIVPQDIDTILADLVKDVLAFGKGKRSPLPLGLMQRPYKKVSFTPLNSGYKKDQEKIKIVGDVLLEFGALKPLDVHFTHST